MINQIKNNMEIIEEICNKSDWMILGMVLSSLDLMSSKQELMGYLKKKITDPCIEIYLYDDLENKELVSGKSEKESEGIVYV
ncbi:MAG: hypothetical protein K2N34_09350 [Lachnospiraceae bacterium]|nr:hypothetical protein [Lachnospiraceae bacterium]